MRSSWRLLGFSCVALGGPWAPVLASLGCSWRPWGHLGALGIYKEQATSWTQMAPIWIGAIGAVLMAALGFLCSSWRLLGSGFDILGSLLAALGAPWGHSVSTRNKRSRGPKRHQSGLVPLVPYSWRLLGFSCVALGGPWARVSLSLGRSWRPLGYHGALGICKVQAKS